MINNIAAMTDSFEGKQQYSGYAIALICRGLNSVLASQPICFDNEGLGTAAGTSTGVAGFRPEPFSPKSCKHQK